MLNLGLKATTARRFILFNVNSLESIISLELITNKIYTEVCSAQIGDSDLLTVGGKVAVNGFAVARDKVAVGQGDSPINEF